MAAASSAGLDCMLTEDDYYGCISVHFAWAESGSRVGIARFQGSCTRRGFGREKQGGLVIRWM